MCVLFRFQEDHRESSPGQPKYVPTNASCQSCQVQRLFRKVGYTAYFGVDHQNMELVGDPMGLQLKE
jgi:hypothetical protein